MVQSSEWEHVTAVYAIHRLVHCATLGGAQLSVTYAMYKPLTCLGTHLIALHATFKIICIDARRICTV